MSDRGTESSSLSATQQHWLLVEISALRSEAQVLRNLLRLVQEKVKLPASLAKRIGAALPDGRR